MWLRPELLAGDTGLSRYFDFGEGPAPESLKDEVDHYRQVVEYFVNHPDQRAGRLAQRLPGESKGLGPGALYSLRLCDLPPSMEHPKCGEIQQLTLSRDFYEGDRAMRESGFDISFRFGPFGADTHHYAAVCLNSLLYKTEIDLAEMSEIVGRKAEAESWRKQAVARRAAINKYQADAVHLPVHHHLLSSLDRRGHSATSHRGRGQLEGLRTPWRRGHEPVRHRCTVGITLCLGAHTDDFGGWTAALRIHRRC